MDEKSAKTSEPTAFPRLDRSVVKVSKTWDDPDEKAYWLSRTPLERLEALELLRQIAYGYDPTTARMQRGVEVAKFQGR